MFYIKLNKRAACKLYMQQPFLFFMIDRVLVS